MEGWVTLVHVLLYIVIISTVMNTEKLWRRFFQLSLVVSAGLSLYNLVGIFSNPLGVDLSARKLLTFGNPSVLATYMLFHIFFAAWMFSKDSLKRSRLLYGFILALDMTALFSTGTRGSLIGVLCGFLLIVFLRSRLAAIAFLLIVGTSAGGLYLARDTSIVQSVGILNRLADARNGASSRVLNMGIAWNGIQERPWLGWGQDNYVIVFDKYFDPRMGGLEPWFDRVHNSIFDWLIAGGIFGLLAYLAIFVSLFWVARKESILLGLFVAYFIHNLFLFDNIISLLFFGSILGYVVWRSTESNEKETVRAKPIMSGAYVFLGMIAVWLINGESIMHLRILSKAFASNNLEQAIPLFEQAAQYNTFGSETYVELLGKVAVASVKSGKISAQVKKRFIDLAIDELSKQEKRSPDLMRIPYFLGILQNVNLDYDGARISLLRALDLSPRKQIVLIQIAMNSVARQDYDAADRYFKTVLTLSPNQTRYRTQYAAVLWQIHRDEEAEALLSPIIPTGDAAQPEIGAALAKRGRFDRIDSIWRARFAVDPTDASPYMYLANLYFSNGYRNEAIDTLERLKKTNPGGTAQADRAIAEIRSRPTI
jgi:O-antigen ligase/tetratricopeptide (TPR) repeat protein